jgi:hypothetical protein
MARGAEGGAWVQGWGARAGRAARACGVPARRSAAGGGDSAASNLQIKGGKARQGTAAGKATGLHLGQGGRGG